MATFFDIGLDKTDLAVKLTEEAINRALDEVGHKAADYAAGLAPVDTGNLKNSMTSDLHPELQQVWVGTDVEYAPSVEYGHNQEVGRYVPAIGKRLVAEHVAAQPFLKPAMERHIDEYADIIRRELSQVEI